MELVFLTPLLKDCTEGIGGGIAINDKGLFEMRLSENRGSIDRVYEGVECGFMLIISVEFATFGAVGNERIKWGSEHAEVTNVHSVEVEKTEEGA